MWCLSLLLLSPTPDLTPARPAPAHGIEAWEGVESGSAEGRVVRSSSGEPDRRGRPLAELAGSVVLLHWVEDEGAALTLVRDLLHCNRDRALVALGLSPGDRARVARDLLGDHGLSHPIGLVDRGATPYGRAPLTVVGRAGELVWSGDPLGDGDELLEHLASALDAWPAPRVEAGLDPSLDDALERYYAGEWAKAEKAAERARHAAPDDAARLLGLLAAFQRDLTTLVSALSSVHDEVDLALLDRALARGWPRSEAAKACAERVQAKRRSAASSTFLDALAWAELQAARPVLFPARRDAAAKRFAKKIAALTRNSNDTELTRLVRGMLEEFEER